MLPKLDAKLRPTLQGSETALQKQTTGVALPEAGSFERTRGPVPLLDEKGTPIETDFTSNGKEAALLATLNRKPVNEAEAIQKNVAIKAARERKAFLHDLIKAYYPIDHANIELVDGDFDVSKIGRVGRNDETGRLRKVSLAVPYALDGDWTFSPTTEDQEVEVDLNKALEQHATLTKYLADNGVKVFLQVQPEAASEAVYNTDVLTGMGKTVLVGSPKIEARRLETEKFVGGVNLANFCGEDSPIEFGDVQLFEKNDKLYVFQGCNSYRATEDSVDAMKSALSYLQRRGDIGEYEHVQVDLTGDKTLHLDYVFGYAGTGDKRVLVVSPDGLSNPGMVDKLAGILEVPDERIIRVSKEDSIAGAANLSSLGPEEVLYIKNPAADRVAAQMRKHGLKVTQFEYDQMSQKDGTLHCSIGQLARD